MLRRRARIRGTQTDDALRRGRKSEEANQRINFENCFSDKLAVLTASYFYEATSLIVVECSWTMRAALSESVDPSISRISEKGSHGNQWS